jgi:hypothetical protein
MNTDSLTQRRQGAKGAKFYENEDDDEDDWVAARKPRWVHPSPPVVELWLLE